MPLTRKELRSPPPTMLRLFIDDGSFSLYRFFQQLERQFILLLFSALGNKKMAMYGFTKTGRDAVDSLVVSYRGRDLYERVAIGTGAGGGYRW